MNSNDNYYTLNIREFLESDSEHGESVLQEYFSVFSCPLNPDIERFLKNQSIVFAKKHQAVTYLVLSAENDDLLAYFSLTLKPLSVSAEPFNSNTRRKLARFSKLNNNNNYNIAAFLIAQLGKNFNLPLDKQIKGKEFMDIIIEQLKSVQYKIGGMVSFVEAENNNKLLSFYEQQGFKRFDTRQTNANDAELVQLLRLI